MSSNDAVSQHRMPQLNGSIFKSGLSRVLLYPIGYWNWKSATVAATIRGSVFVLAMGRHGGQKGALIEICTWWLRRDFLQRSSRGCSG